MPSELEERQLIKDLVDSRSATVTGSGEFWISKRQQMPCWFDDCVMRLAELSQLKFDWDSYGAKPTNQISIHYAHIFLSLIGQVDGIDCPRITSTPDGFVGFSWDDDIISLDVEIDDSGHFIYVGERTDGTDLDGSTTDSGTIISLLTQL